MRGSTCAQKAGFEPVQKDPNAQRCLWNAWNVNNMPIKFNKKYNLKTATVSLIIKTERSGYSH